MSDLRELYQEVIIDHSRKPHNYGKLEGATALAEGFNPLCGDKIKLYLAVRDGKVADARFEGSGCAISMASASMMTDALKGLSRAEAEKIFQQFHEMLTGGSIDPEDLGKLAVFSGVSEFPTRVKCAVLPWHALHNALSGKHEIAVTEDGTAEGSGK